MIKSVGLPISKRDFKFLLKTIQISHDVFAKTFFSNLLGLVEGLVGARQIILRICQLTCRSRNQNVKNTFCASKLQRPLHQHLENIFFLKPLA